MKRTNNIISRNLDKIKPLFNKDEQLKIQATIDYFENYYEFLTKDNKPINDKQQNSNNSPFVSSNIKIVNNSNNLETDDGYDTNSNSASENNTSDDEEIFYDALDHFDFLTNYNKIEIDEMQKLNPPITPEKLWTSTITTNDVLKDEIDNAVDAFEYFKNKNNLETDDGYDTNSNSASENNTSDDEEIFYDAENNLKIDDNYELIITSNYDNLNSISKTAKPIKDINKIQIDNSIIMKKLKNRTWSIQQKSQNDNKINKEIILEKKENDILENLIKQYNKSKITIIFNKNTKNFKEAFVIDNYGNKKNISINEIEKIKILEKIFLKTSKILNQSINDFDAKDINAFKTPLTSLASKSNNNKSSNKNNIWRKYVTRM